MNDLKDFLFTERVARARRTIGELRLKAGQWPIEAADPEPTADQPGRWLAKRAEQDLLLLGAEIEQGVARIQQDRRFSDEGKNEQLKIFADGLRGKLARIEKMATQKLGVELEHAQADFAKATTDKPGSEVVGAIRGMELRNRLLTLTDAQRLDAFWTAVRDGDGEMIGAFESAPRAFKLIDSDTLNEGLAEFRRRSNPALAADLDALAGVHETITGHLRSMANVLGDLAGVEKPVDALMPSADNE
jgi:hypothetical protein